MEWTSLLSHTSIKLKYKGALSHSGPIVSVKYIYYEYKIVIYIFKKGDTGASVDLADKKEISSNLNGGLGDADSVHRSAKSMDASIS